MSEAPPKSNKRKNQDAEGSSDVVAKKQRRVKKTKDEFLQALRDGTIPYKKCSQPALKEYVDERGLRDKKGYIKKAELIAILEAADEKA
mmetsp:Transcript_7236/g.7943  ORF Transcript_7236/g.7943 Transcript_7236/m.7943 type:complete len:89 (-) Transcript_7236:218-484(-)